MNNNYKTDTAVEVVNLSKSFGSVVALNSVNFAIESGQYFVLLGPSGGGKTTLLRLIGGLLRPTEGRILLHGKDATNLPPDKRATSMVFQSYALFPHMSVADNVSFGLKLRKRSKAEIRERVQNMLNLVGLDGYNKRMPHEFSGGQQQRVQLARSLVLESDILLLDEPLAALDAKLRKDMCLELKHIQDKVGITFIHVTHNQEEAMTIADRIAIVANGELVEESTPRQVYEDPSKHYTADFIGENNIFAGQIISGTGKRKIVDIGFATIEIETDNTSVIVNDEVAISIRSELLKILDPDQKSNGEMQTISGTYMEEVYLGLTTSHLVSLPNGEHVTIREMSMGSSTRLSRGSEVQIGWQLTDARLHIA